MLSPPKAVRQRAETKRHKRNKLSAADAHLLFLYSSSSSWYQPPSAFALAHSARATYPPFPDQALNRNITPRVLVPVYPKCKQAVVFGII
jgi:hypothetical protein